MAKRDNSERKPRGIKMSATDREGNTHTTTGSGSTGRTHESRDGSVTQTDGDQVIRE